jgi:hypothetical protein
MVVAKEGTHAEPPGDVELVADADLKAGPNDIAGPHHGANAVEPEVGHVERGERVKAQAKRGRDVRAEAGAGGALAARREDVRGEAKLDANPGRRPKLVAHRAATTDIEAVHGWLREGHADASL